MRVQIRTPAIAVITIAVLPAGCDDGTGVGLPDAFDPVAIEAAVDETLTPIQASLGPRAALLDAFDALAGMGLTFDRSGSATPAFGPVGFGSVVTGPVWDGPAIARTEIPTELQGKTFVYDAQDQSWSADEGRTGAPGDGVRIIWYDTDAAGSFLIPLEERGYVDLTDEDSGTLSRLGARMVETAEGGDVTLVDFIQGYRVTDDTEWSNHAEAAGFYADASETVVFDLVSDASGSHDTGDQQSTLVVTLDGASATYSLEIGATESGGDDTADQDLTATVLHGGVTTELDLDLTHDGGTQSGEGTISYDGRVIVRVTVEGSSFRYRDADGESFSTGTVSALDSLVRTLFLTGLTAVTTLPLLFP